MNKKFDYLKAYFISCFICVLYLVRMLIPELAPNLGWKTSSNNSIMVLLILVSIMYIFYFKGFKYMANIGFIQYILFMFAISLGFGAALLLVTLWRRSCWKILYAIFCVVMLVIYRYIYKGSTQYVSVFSNILLSLIINNLILLNTIIWDLFDLTKFNSLLNTLDIDLSGELIINLVLFPVLLMTSCGAFINAKDEYYKNKGKDKVINKDKNTEDKENSESQNNAPDDNIK